MMWWPSLHTLLNCHKGNKKYTAWSNTRSNRWCTSTIKFICITQTYTGLISISRFDKCTHTIDLINTRFREFWKKIHWGILENYSFVVDCKVGNDVKSIKHYNLLEYLISESLWTIVGHALLFVGCIKYLSGKITHSIYNDTYRYCVNILLNETCLSLYLKFNFFLFIHTLDDYILWWKK